MIKSYKEDPRLVKAADKLGWAIRWFYHMWVTKENQNRWTSRSKWKKYLDTGGWNHALHLKMWDEGFNHDLPKRTVDGIAWLVNRWFGRSLTLEERNQLIEMLKPKKR